MQILKITYLCCAGGSIHFACTGIVIGHTKTTANLLASLNLFRSSYGDREITDKMEVGIYREIFPFNPLLAHFRLRVLILLTIMYICLLTRCFIVILQTKVRLPNNHVVSGFLLSHDLKHNLAVVRAWPKGGGIRTACLDHQQQQLESHSQVVAVRRCFSSGKLMATTAMSAGDPMGAYPEQVAISINM